MTCEVPGKKRRDRDFVIVEDGQINLLGTWEEGVVSGVQSNRS